MALTIEDMAFLDEGDRSETWRQGEAFDLMRAGFRYRFLEQAGICVQAIKLLKLDRLRYVSQFGFTTIPVKPQATSVNAPIYRHTRFSHVCDVTAVALRVAAANRLSPIDRRHIAVAAMTHDVMTPAGGDCTKEVNPAAFDEDAHYPRIFAHPGWPRLRQVYGLDEKRLASIVLNEGMLGELLDWADKIAYMARDTQEYVSMMKTHDATVYKNGGLSHEIFHLLSRRPRPMALWKNLSILQDRVACDDAEALADFLHLRMLFFREIHYSSYTRFLRVFIDAALRVLLHREVLTHENLLTMDDGDLMAAIHEHTGLHITSFDSEKMGKPHVLSFDTLEKFREYDRYLRAEGVMIRFGIDRGRLLKPRTDLPVLTMGRRVMSLHDAFPSLAAPIEQLAAEAQPFVLYWLEGRNRQLKPGFVKGLKKLRDAA